MTPTIQALEPKATYEDVVRHAGPWCNGPATFDRTYEIPFDVELTPAYPDDFPAEMEDVFATVRESGLVTDDRKDEFGLFIRDTHFDTTLEKGYWMDGRTINGKCKVLDDEGLP